MKFLLRLRTRILVTAGICAFLLVSVSAIFILERLKSALLQTVAESPYLFSPHDEATCLENPQAWFKVKHDDGTLIYAYDSRTGKSANPKAPPIATELWNEILNGKKFAILTSSVTTRMMQRGKPNIVAHFVRKAGAPGPCGVIQGSFAELPPVRFAVESGLLAASFLGVFMVIGIMMIFTIRPIRQRLQRLSLAARNVGDENSYISAQDQLEDDIGEISTVLDNAHVRMRRDAEHLRHRSEVLEQHLANVAHDLRTPISSLHLGLQELQSHLNSDIGQELLGRTINDSAYLMGLTDNLHLASRLSGGVDPTAENARTDLSEVVDKLELRFSLLGKISGIKVVAARPDSEVGVICDPFMAERALSNIVHNAVAYGERGGNVAVVLEVVEDHFKLTVSDDGPGVPPEELPKLADRTFRSDDARQRDSRGQGLGLAITHEIAKRCGWTLEFDKIKPHGLRVTVKGPVVK